MLSTSKWGGVKWRTFDFIEIFEIKNGFYNKKPACFANGDIPFIGATEMGNGITGFTNRPTIENSSKTGHGTNEPIGRKLFPGGAICVTNNGSVGHAYYQPHEFTCTHDVNPLYLRHRASNRYIATFICRCIEQQRECFAYARKWRPSRMRKSKLSLPIDNNGQPHWDYMENCMRQIESKHILDYLKHKIADVAGEEFAGLFDNVTQSELG